MKHPIFTITVFMLALLSCTVGATAQPWLQNVKTQPNKQATFNDIKAAFNDYWQDRPIEKGKGYKQFKRWEWYWETRILPDGTFPNPIIVWNEWEKYLQTHPDALQKMGELGANWQFMGPATTPGGYNGLGRLNCIAFHPTNLNTFWVGSPGGGLWKTTDGGGSWTTSTDLLPTLGVTDIAINTANPNVLYIATGDGNLGSLSALTGGADGDTKSIGVLKSTDGGNTWSYTGLNWNVQSAKLIRRLLINPANPQILLAAASDGIWRSTDGGNNWLNTQAGYFMDMEFKPGDPNTVYAATYSADAIAGIYRSANGGASWALIGNIPGVMRIDLAVTPAMPQLVDAVFVDYYGGLQGLWYSQDSGLNYEQYFVGSQSANMLNWELNAAGEGGQGFYDLAYALHPANANEIWLGGINTWKSVNAGSLWNIVNYWYQNDYSIPIIHADKHALAFHPLNPNYLFECNDGGVYVTANGGQTWTDLSNGLGISQIYRIGVSQTIPNNIICGLQDNGSREIYNNQWYEQTGGDGMECIIDYSNADIEYASYARGVIYRTFNFWQTKTTISNNIPILPEEQNGGAWVTPFVIDPINPQTLYVGYKRVYKTINRGDSWAAISPKLTSDNLRSIAVAPSNPNYIYAATFDTLYLTENGGANWYFVPVGIPDAKITYIAIHPSNPQMVWITLGGYNAGQKIYQTTNAGLTWTNLSGTLPNVSVNCVTVQKYSNNALYIGTDVGVFYRDATITDWIPYQNGLPNVVVTELEISYNDNQLWAATFGRGLWKSDLFNSPAVSVTNLNLVPDDIVIYPNPTNGTFTLQAKPELPCLITVYSTAGISVLTEKRPATAYHTINLPNNITQGIYFVHIQQGENTSVKKISISSSSK